MAKRELLRLALKGRALTFFKSINATSLSWDIVQSKFREQFMSRTKKAEISAELDSLHLSSLRADGDSDRQALEKLIARLDKLSLMGTDDDKRDDSKIRRLYAAIEQEQWKYFALCKLPVVYSYEEMVRILRKSITDLSAFERQRKKKSSPSSQPNHSDNDKPSAQSTSQSPWSDSSSTTNPPSPETLFARNLKNNNNNNSDGRSPRRVCFNSKRECCMLGRCPDPINLKNVAANLEKFKREKAERSNKSTWNAKRISISQLNPNRNEWSDIYEVIVTEALLAQHSNEADTPNHDTSSDPSDINNSAAFIIDNDPSSTLHIAFQKAVGEDDPDTADSNFTSLFDVMTTQPSLHQDDDESFETRDNRSPSLANQTA